jgi:hypothetical protein
MSHLFEFSDNYNDEGRSTMANMDGVGFDSCDGIVCGIDNLIEHARGLGDFLNSDVRPLIFYCKIQLCLFVASSFPHRHDLASTPWVG